MSECVVRMEMPKNRCPVRFSIAANGYCPIEDRSGCGFDVTKERPDWCPIICVLPEGHGRLGDLDALADDVRSLWDYKTVDGITATTVLNQTLTDIRNCLTIVPAERRAQHGEAS